jgi:apolipoprotein D and lipocalin family protein
MSDTAATYRLLEDGNVAVVNRCRTVDGVDETTGVARRLDGRTDRLEVSFLPAALRWLPFGWGRYWIIELAPDYRYAVVGEPSREYLWVLARTRTLSPEDRLAIEARLPAHGYDPKRLVDSPQPKS